MGLATSTAKKEPELRTAPPSKPHMQLYGGYYADGDRPWHPHGRVHAPFLASSVPVG